MRWKQAVGHDVIDTTTAESVGKIDSLIVDPGTTTVVGILVGGRVVSFDDAGGIGRDALTLPGPDVLREPSSDLELRAAKGASDPIGKRVITEDGVDIGVVGDVELDAETGTIRELVLADDEVKGSRLIGIGSFAVVVSSPGRASTSTDGLDSLSKSELYEMAKERDLAGRSSMSKQELVAALS